MTETQIKYFGNESIGEMEDNLNRRLIGNHKEVNTGCSIKKKSPMWEFYSCFGILICIYGANWYYCTLCHYVKSSSRRETTKGGGEIYKKKHIQITEPCPSRACQRFQHYLSVTGVVEYFTARRRLRDKHIQWQ